MIYVPKHISNSKTKAPVAFDFILPCILYDNSLSLVKHVGENKILTELLHFGHELPISLLSKMIFLFLLYWLEQKNLHNLLNLGPMEDGFMGFKNYVPPSQCQNCSGDLKRNVS